MAHITLKQLHYFEALARHKHFGRAAADCSISQPALSMQVKELEESLGANLIERMAREIRLTPLGEEVVERARDVLRAVSEIGDLGKSWRDSLRMGVIATIAPYLLPRLAEALSQNYPDIELTMREAQTHKLIEEIMQGRLDAAILALPISEPQLEELELFDEPFVLVRPLTDHGRPVPNSERLKEMRMLLLEEGHCFRDQALAFCNMQSATPREVLDASSLATLVQMVSAGFGITLIPEMAVPVETRSAAVAIDRFPEPEPTRKIGMVWRKTSPLADELTEVAQVVAKAAQAMQTRSRTPACAAGF